MRPNKLRQELAAAKKALKGKKPKIVYTFARKMTPYDTAVRRFQKRRINTQRLPAMLKSKDPVLRGVAIERIVNTNPRILAKIGLPFIMQMVEDKDMELRIAATDALWEIGYAGLPLLTRLEKDKSVYVRIAATNAIGKIAKWGTRRRYLSNLSPEVQNVDFSLLVEMARNNAQSVRRDAARDLGKLGIVGLPILKELMSDKDKTVRKAAAEAISRINSRKLMLATRKPFASTAHLPEILKRLDRLEKISGQLKKEFKEAFVGVVVFGSMSKGYAIPESDVDYAVIADNKKAIERFHELAGKHGLPLCLPFRIEEQYVNPKEISTSNAGYLFSGLFFGDRKMLRQLQKETFVKFTPVEWDKIREELLKHEAEVDFERLGIESKREQQRLKAAAALRIPPPYKEMKKLLGIK